MYPILLCLAGLCPEPPAPVTAADLAAVRTLDWGGEHYPISLDRDGRYWCGPRDGVGSDAWGGDWRIEAGVLVLREANFHAPADAVPERRSDYGEVRLVLTRRGGVLVGTGWGHPVRLSR